MNARVVRDTVAQLWMPTAAPSETVAVVVVPFVHVPVAVVVNAVADVRVSIRATVPFDLTRPTLGSHAVHARRQAGVLTKQPGRDLALNAEHAGIDQHAAATQRTEHDQA
jgi:hypothetical protein